MASYCQTWRRLYLELGMVVSVLSHCDYQRVNLNLRLKFLKSKLQNWVNPEILANNDALIFWFSAAWICDWPLPVTLLATELALIANTYRAFTQKIHITSSKSYNEAILFFQRVKSSFGKTKGITLARSCIHKISTLAFLWWLLCLSLLFR